MIEQLPDLDRCREIVTNNSVEFYEQENLQTKIAAEIPMAVSSLRVTLDEERVQDIPASSPEKERYKEFDNPTGHTFRWTFEWSATEMFGTGIADTEQWIREEGITNIGERVRQACNRGFLTRPVYASWEEPTPQSLDDYVEMDPEGWSDPATFNMEEKRERIGTKRWGVTGIITGK